jgi:large subunit ribosomal protein L18
MKKKEKKLYILQKKRFLNKISGTAEKPRLTVFRSHKHIYAQLINDAEGKTLACASTVEKATRNSFKAPATKDASYIVGKVLAEKAKIKNITFVIFDRGNKQYHGRIQSLADGARFGGLSF